MTDEQMDARLRRAGETWRAAVATLPASQAEPDDPLPLQAPRRRGHVHRGALIASAAVVTAALIAGAVLALNTGGNRMANPSATPLRGTVWRLIGYAGEQPQPDSLATLTIGKDGTLVADDGCNLIGIHVEVQDGRVFPNGTFDLRQRYCTGTSASPTFGKAVDVLTRAPSYSISADRLSIGAMRFVAAPALPAPTLDVPTFVGSTWQLTQVANPQGRTQRVDGTLLLARGRLTVSDGCDTLTGYYVGYGRDVSWKTLTSTTHKCPYGAKNAVVDKVFSGTTVDAQVTGATLTITRPGAGTLFYEWVPGDKSATDPANLINRNWHLVSAAGEPASAGATLRIANEYASGNDGCAPFAGPALDIAAGTMSLRGVPSQPPASCVAGDQARTVDSLLGARPALWSIRDGKLIVNGDGPQARSLVYSTTVPPATATGTGEPPLLGTVWQLTTIETAGSGSAGGVAFSASGVTLTLSRTGVTLAAGNCTDSQGHVAVRGSTAVFSDVHFLASLCPPGPGGSVDPEAAIAVRDLLAGAVHWSIADGTLRLTKGSTTITFSA